MADNRTVPLTELTALQIGFAVSQEVARAQARRGLVLRRSVAQGIRAHLAREIDRLSELAKTFDAASLPDSAAVLLETVDTLRFIELSFRRAFDADGRR
jgi:hypothetical protein